MIEYSGASEEDLLRNAEDFADKAASRLDEAMESPAETPRIRDQDKLGEAREYLREMIKMLAEFRRRKS